MHFYPGVAEYTDVEGQSYRIFVNEDAIRKMEPSFAGCPLFVQHVDDVSDDLDTLRDDADGWVIESFFNEADGKHWVKFIVVSERGERAVKSGLKLSNAYTPEIRQHENLWNGVSYDALVTGGKFEHLALVDSPRYSESVVLTPEEFKKYNSEKRSEIERISNSNSKGKTMSLKFFKKSAVKNEIDADMSVLLPKSGREITLVKALANYDAFLSSRKLNKDGMPMANPDHMVKLKDGSEMSVKDMMDSHSEMKDALAEKDPADEREENSEEDERENSEEEEDEREKNSEEEYEALDESPEKVDVDNPQKKNKDESEDEGAREKALELAEHESEEIREEKSEKKDSKKNKKQNSEQSAASKAKAERLRNAHRNPPQVEFQPVFLAGDEVARGQARYGKR